MKVLEILAELKRAKVVPRIEAGQLKLAGATKDLSKEFIERIRNEKDELIAFLKKFKDAIDFSPIPAVGGEGIYNTTNAQKRLWVLSQFEGGSIAYNIVTGLYLKGKVEPHNLNKAFQYCINRHESLRTVFREIDGELKQVVLDNLSFNIEFEQAGQVTDIKSYLRTEMVHSGNWSFDLENGPLIRIKLIQLEEDSYAMIFGVHHLISDGWSIGLIVQEVMSFYESYCKDELPAAEPLRIHYKDYTNWLMQKLDGPRGISAKEFWHQEFIEELVPLNLPEDFLREQVRGFEGKLLKVYFDTKEFTLIEEFCKKNQITLFNFLRAALSVLLYKFSGQKDITIGTPVSGRNHFDIENQIGLYVNTLPLRAKIDDNESFLDFLKRISDNSIKAFEYQDYPFDKIVDDLNIKRDTSRNPLFDIMMVLQNTALGDGSIQFHQQYGFELNKLEHFLAAGNNTGEESRSSKFDLSFNFDSDTGNKFYVEIEYASKLFKKGTIEKLLNSFFYIITQLIDSPGDTIGMIQSVDPVERHKILNDFNGAIGEIYESRITDLLKDPFLKNKDHIALITDKSSFTYEQIHTRSNNVAAYLQQFVKGSEVKFFGLLLYRSELTLISILGILKAGGAYVPVDVNYPPARIDYIVNDAGLEVILTDGKGITKVPADFKGQVINIENLDEHIYSSGTGLHSKPANKEDTAYLIYTSGSTGNPKGVEIAHKNTIAFLKWAATEFSATPYEILYAATSYCFDLSVFEFFLPLMQGKTIRLLNSALQIPEFLDHDQKVMLNTVPSVVRTLLDQGTDWKNVCAVNMAGEPIPAKIKKELDYHVMEVRNLYGPTEDTTYSTVYKFVDDDYSNIPIGRPVGDTHIYVMDASMNLVPIGTKGELYLSGQGIAKGYYRNERLTAGSFFSNPFLPEMKMYRTGDVGKWLEDGQIEFMGRIDDQVKIRGYRIELSEIRHILEQHPDIEQVVITKVNGENEHLVAYWVGKDSLNTAALKEYLAQRLPSFMVPDYWLKLAAIPLNSNGKVDKKQLPDPVLTIAEESLVEPVNELQFKLIQLWKQVLNISELGIKNNFFDLGGHSLKAIKLRTLILKEFGVEFSLNELFGAITVESQAKLIGGKSKGESLIIPKVTEQPYYPISFSQERLWVLTNFEEASKAYNMSAAFRIFGNILLDKLEDAFHIVIKRHEILRTVFTEKDGNAVQVILAPEELGFSIEKLSFDKRLSSAEEAEFLRNKWNTAFELGTGPLLRCFFLKTQDSAVLSFSMHHIISDGWSINVLFRDVLSVYAEIINGSIPEDRILEVQYKDFAAWQKSLLAAGKMQEHHDFWKEIFKDEIPVLELPADFHRPEIKTYNGATYTYQFTHQVSEQINALSRKSGGTLFMTLISAVNILLKKYANQNEIVIGTPVAGRAHEQLNDQIGFYVNTLAILTKMDGGEVFRDFLSRQKDIFLQALNYQDYPFELLLEELNIKRNLSRSPLFDVMVVLQNLDDLNSDSLDVALADLQLQRLSLSGTVAKYDLTFTFFESADGLSLELEYNTDLFKRESIEKITGYLVKIFEQVIAAPDILIKDISLLAPGEAEKIIADTDHIDVPYNRDMTILSLFRESVTKFPDSIALVAGEKEFTYREIDQKSGTLAALLVNEYNVLPEDLILLHFERTEWIVISILAVLKSGAAYVPVDPSYPSARIDYIIGDSGSKLLLFDEEPSAEITAKWIDVKLVDVKLTTDEVMPDPIVTVTPENLAYVIYTSGTTGNPKGVLIEHGQVTRLFFNEGSLFDFNENDRWVLFHSYCFDVSVWEMYGALLNGGTLVMVPKETTQNSIAFYDFLSREQITILNQTPTAFRSLVQNNRERFVVMPLDKVRYLNFAGEALTPNILTEWHAAMPGCKNINLYGITETTVHVTYKEISTDEIRENKSNVGLPLPTLSCYVLDLDQQFIPAGIIGELYVGGAGVARGYLNKAELTAERFLPNPFRTGEKMYRSGDYAKILPSGDIEYIGRKDDQVKIRGHRIEIHEIEVALIKMDGVRDAVVIPLKSPNGDYELIAYYISDDASKQDHRRRLMELLPAYMIPSFIIELPSFPVNKNGKLDKQALPAPESVHQRLTPYVPGRNDIDNQIIEIWESILQKENIGIKDNFFDLGGHSLKATRVISKINEVYGIKIDLKHLFIDPTVEHLSNYIETVQWMESEQGVSLEGEDELIF